VPGVGVGVGVTGVAVGSTFSTGCPFSASISLYIEQELGGFNSNSLP